MKIIKDDEGRPWNIAITAASALRVQSTVRVMVERQSTRPDGKTYSEMASEPFLISDVSRITATLNTLRNGYTTAAETVWAIVEPQAAERNVSRESFLNAMTGDVLDQMSNAVAAELIDFFPSSQRPMLHVLQSKLDEVSELLVNTAHDRIKALDTTQAITAAQATGAFAG